MSTQAPSLSMARGIQLLQTLGAHSSGLTVSELAAELNIHRPAVYRLLAAMLDARWVRRTTSGAYVLGFGIVELAGSVEPHLRQVCLPHLRALADALGATTALNLRHGDEMVVIASAEPTHQALRISYPPGHRHSVDRGAAGLAVLAAGHPLPGERSEVARARHLGYAVSDGDLLPGAVGIAVALRGGDIASASVSAVWVGQAPGASATDEVAACADRILADLLPSE